MDSPCLLDDDRNIGRATMPPTRNEMFRRHSPCRIEGTGVPLCVRILGFPLHRDEGVHGLAKADAQGSAGQIFRFALWLCQMPGCLTTYYLAKRLENCRCEGICARQVLAACRL